MLSATSGTVTYITTRDELIRVLDGELKQVAYSMVSHIKQTSLLRLGEANEAESNLNFSYQVWDSHGQLIFTSNDSMTLPQPTLEGFGNVRWADTDWRTYSVKRPRYTVQVAENLQVQSKRAAEAALRMLLPTLIFIPIFALLIWQAVGRGLSPLRRLTGELQGRAPHELAALDTGRLPLEIQPLVQALNQLLDNLAHILSSQRQFIADAAHELRTPLTAINLQSQLLANSQTDTERQQGIQQLQTGIQRAIHLVQQLLILARLDPEAYEHAADGFGPLRLDTIINNVVIEQNLFALKRDIDLGVLHSEAVSIHGDPHRLHILIGSLVDNAIRYTPAGGTIDLSVSCQQQQATVVISDTGPGIPPEERERVFDRFYRRAGEEQPGSGLGLAIVKRITEAHQGQITLGDSDNGGPGLKVTLTFPTAT